MSDNSTVLQLSPEDFSLSDYDNVRITLPEKPSISREDVDAQLFGFVLSTGRSVNSIDDLDDEWVKGNFEGLSTIEDVRQAIVDDYERNLELEYSDMKYRACCDALSSGSRAKWTRPWLQATWRACARRTRRVSRPCTCRSSSICATSP